MVSAYVELLARRYRGQLDERADVYINFALDGARRMRELIDSLLDYARLRTSERTVGSVDLHAVANRVVSDARAGGENDNMTIRLGELPVVSGDAGELSRLLQNLVSNALKFRATADPVIEISAGREAGGWQVRVDDNGIGIPEDQYERVFELFGRLHPRSEFPGTGMGLALCRGIVEAHGGRIWVERSPLGGTRVCFTLPPDESDRTP